MANTPTATPTATLARNSFRLRQPAPAGSILLEVSNGNRMPPGADSITAINGSPVCIKFNRREDQLALGKPLDEPLTEADQIERVGNASLELSLVQKGKSSSNKNNMIITVDRDHCLS